MPVLEPCFGFAFDCYPQRPWIDQLCGPQVWVQPTQPPLCNAPDSVQEVTSFSGMKAQLGWWMTRTLQRSRDAQGNLDCQNPPDHCPPSISGGGIADMAHVRLGPVVSADEFAPVLFDPQPDGTLRARLGTFQSTRYRRFAPGCIPCFGAGEGLCGNTYPRDSFRWVEPICRIVGFAGYMLHLRVQAVVPKCVFGQFATECSGIVATWRFFPTISSNVPAENAFHAVGIGYPPAPGATDQDRCDTQTFAPHDVFIPLLFCDQTIDLYIEGPCDAAKAQDCSATTGQNWPYPWPWDRRTSFNTRIVIDILEAWLEVA